MKRGTNVRCASTSFALVCIFAIFLGKASCLKFRMFPNLAQKECITEDVPEEQWNLVLDSVEANFRKNANRNLSDAEIATRLSNFKRPVKIEFGLLTMAPTKNDRSQKPISYVLTGSSGEVIGTKSGVTQEEIDFKTVGTNGPYTLCLTAEKEFGVVEVDVSFFAVNVPEAVGTTFEKSSEMSEDDLRDMQPSITDEEMEFYAKEEHIVELKGDMRKLGSAVYQAYYEQQHIKQILNRQHRSIAYVSIKTKVFGYVEAFLIVLCSLLQYLFVRRLFKNKKVLQGLMI